MAEHHDEEHQDVDHHDSSYHACRLYKWEEHCGERHASAQHDGASHRVRASTTSPSSATGTRIKMGCTTILPFISGTSTETSTTSLLQHGGFGHPYQTNSTSLNSTTRTSSTTGSTTAGFTSKGARRRHVPIGTIESSSVSRPAAHI